MAQAAEVPFVGCASDGQVGPEPAPAPRPIPTPPSHVADRVAYYAIDETLGVLGPRGWHCARLYGSSGWTLFVAPEDISPADFLTGHRSQHLEWAVVVRVSAGGTSGRFHVAQVAARLFPRARPFVQRVIDEGFMPKEDFPFGPFATDSVTRRSDFDVDFTTPAHHDGMGTSLELFKNDQPIQGLAMLLGGENDLAMATIRLPPRMRDLVPPILAALRTEIGRASK